MTSESVVQAAVRLEYARRGYELFRNNSGALRDDTGRVIRFGLGNDSSAANAVYKSSDLIGWYPTLITPEWFGVTIARFVSIECKPSDWHLTAGDKRGQAQKRWIDKVNAAGGYGAFLTGVSE